MFAFIDATEDETHAANDNVDYNRLGRVAEFLVCADLTRIGHYAAHIDAQGFDVMLVAYAKSYRVQVKSSSVIRGGKCVWRCRINESSARGGDARKRELTRADADLLALYHHGLGRIIYYPVKPGVDRIEVPITQVQTITSEASLEAALAAADTLPR